MADTTLLLDGGRAQLDLAARQLLLSGQPARLGGRAFDLLVALVERRGRVVSKQELLDVVWPGLFVEENNLQVHVMSLRKLLGPQAIATVSGRGYRFTLATRAPTLSAGSGLQPLPVRAEPAAADGLIGRAELLATVARHLREGSSRLVSLTGPGGSGKTRLALHVAAQLAPEMRDGAYTVLLAPVRDATLVLAAVAAALGLQEGGAGSVASLVQGFLRGRQVLLMLDNLEHLPGAAAEVAALLDAAPELKVLTTTRVRLHLAGEQVLSVPPLALPPGDASQDTPQDLARSPAVELLARRAAALGRPLRDAADDWQAAARICRRVDGLPLAIELAAARLRVLSPTALADRLQQSLPLLKGGAADVPQRQQALRDTIAWSHDLLDGPTQRLFRRLGVCAGGCSLDAAEALDAALDASATPDHLETLLDHHLLLRLDDVEGEPRYAMLETIREFALEQLAAAGELQQVRQQHAQFFLRLAQQGEQALTSAGRMPWLARLRADLNNLRLALAWALREQPQALLALQLASAMTWLWYFEGAYREGLAGLQAALDMAGAEGLVAERAAALSGVARLASFVGDMALGHQQSRASVALWRSLADSPETARGQGFALLHGGVPALFAEGPAAANELLCESAEQFRRAGDVWGVAVATVYQGVVLAVLPGTEDAAAPVLAEGYERCLALGDDWAASTCSGYMGVVALRRGDHVQARRRFEHILASARETGDRFRIGRSAHFLAELELDLQRWAEAASLLVESISLTVEQGRLGDYPLMLCCMARALVGLGHHKAAVQLLAAGSRPAAIKPSLPPDDPARVAAAVQACRAALTAKAFDDAWHEGLRLDIHEALRRAQAALAQG